jgi:hypothetical protein
MDMRFPIEVYGQMSPYVSLVASFFIGIGFGFFLERAGFGNARKLAAQFYLRDFAVLKVMFTAIVVASVGFWWLVLMGFIDLSMTFINPTFIGAQAIGGLILGVGFIIGGYCPGTSCVATATGKIDGLVYLAGVVFGILVFSLVQPGITKLHNLGSMGEAFVWKWLGISPGIMVLIAVAMAVGAFTWGTKMERKKNAIVNPND